MYELHDYAHSAAAYRVRIALALKGVDVSAASVDLLHGEQHEPSFRALNPQGLVPVFSDGRVHLSQSLAILEYLDECYPEPPLLPGTREQRARARQIANIICCDVHPLNGFRVHVYMRDALGLDMACRRGWFRHWLLEGLDALELWLTGERGARRYCTGDEVSIADLCLVPQLDVARRNHVDIEEFPRLAAVEAACMELAAFRDTHPGALPGG